MQASAARRVGLRFEPGPGAPWPCGQPTPPADEREMPSAPARSDCRQMIGCLECGSQGWGGQHRRTDHPNEI